MIKTKDFHIGISKIHKTELKSLKTYILSILFFGFVNSINGQYWAIQSEPTLPEPVSNNAVVGVEINGAQKVYSFTGIDGTKVYSGIHLKSFCYDVQTQTWSSLPDVPDTQGKIGVAASAVDTIIYIIGGYHVNTNGTEVTSPKVHRYDAKNDVFLADGTDVSTPTDDHVQAVWKDSLIFVITGWSNSTNINKVQIYNPYTDSWQMGTDLPNTNDYKSFGASGTIIGDTIFYFGGANSGSFSFAAQPHVRKGIINPNDPTQISWSIATTDSVGYRSACVEMNGQPYWIGGSKVTYNYNGIAYNGSGGVPSSKRIIGWNGSNWLGHHSYNQIPMDLQGAAKFSNGDVYIVGGMTGQQDVTDQVLKLNWQSDVGVSKASYDFKIFPNPVVYNLAVASDQPIQEIKIFDQTGKLLYFQNDVSKNEQINFTNFSEGIYILKIKTGNRVVVKKVIKTTP